MPKLYPIKEEDWPNTGTRYVLYVVVTGRIINYSDRIIIPALGEQARITAGDWAIKILVLPAFQLAELKNGNIKLGIGGNPVLIGPKTYTNVKPV